MQLIIDIKNESIADKIKTILNVFKDDGVKVQELKTKNQQEGESHSERSYPGVPETILSDEYIKEHWRKIGMSTHSADLDDDERSYEAYGEFYSDKHTD